MKRTILTVIITIYSISIFTQVSEMKWELDYQIYMKLANDSNYVYDIREAFHVIDSKQDITSDYIFYPVNPGQEFADVVSGDPITATKYTTLWSALHAKIGGGWIHFINCIAYALETQKLSLTAPLMQRPQTKWKPKPMTDSYKRTSSWEYYVPYSQKNAQKEYKRSLSSDNLNDLHSLPNSYIDIFLNTSQSQYEQLIKKGEFKNVAKIDLVKIILGAKYLGEAQITYISNAVLGAVLAYSSNMLPSVIIFDEFEAAAAMSLNADGYKIESIVYKSSSNINDEEASERSREISQIVTKINEYNRNSFKQSLGNYYKE